MGKNSGGYEFIFIELEAPNKRITIKDGYEGQAMRLGLNQIFDWKCEIEANYSLIKQEFESKRSALLDKLNNNASKHNFQVKAAQNGIYMMPIVDGKVLEEEEFNKLDDEIKKQYEEKSVLVQEQIMTAISQIKEIERQSDKKISEWQSNVALLTVNAHINYIKSKYKRKRLTSCGDIFSYSS